MKNSYKLLRKYVCRVDGESDLSEVLGADPGLDITSNEGELLILAIGGGNTAMLKLLLGYFHDNQLRQYKADSLEYLTLKKKMHEILEIAIEDVKLSDSMKEILADYINFDDNSSDVAMEEILKKSSIDALEESYGSEGKGTSDASSWLESHLVSHNKNLGEDNESHGHRSITSWINQITLASDVNLSQHESSLAGDYN